ncbi:hypothetical protein BVX99_01395 [bacterium F16]|nr:hypothetical protein BVX99_01395 [bacterium F16]
MNNTTPEPPLILIIDEDQSFFSVLQIGLSSEGFDLIYAGNGKHAQACCEDHIFSAIIAESSIPELDGIQFTQWLRSHSDKPIPVIMMSSRTDAETREAADAAGVTQFLAKPVSYEAILMHLRKLTGIIDG